MCVKLLWTPDGSDKREIWSLLSDMCNKWERWEPEDKRRKKPVKTFWRRIEEEKDNIE